MRSDTVPHQQHFVTVAVVHGFGHAGGESLAAFFDAGNTAPAAVDEEGAASRQPEGVEPRLDNPVCGKGKDQCYRRE